MELQGVRRKVFEDRYAARDANNNLLETRPEEMWQRVARTIAEAETNQKDRQAAEQDFYEAMENFKFVPGGRILSGAGILGKRTFYNCFVIPSPEDSRGGIMESVGMMAEIMARGGGVGVNLSTLRPKGSYVRGVNGTASGAVSFGGLYSYVTGLIIQGGSRRGALMIMLNDDHPDIEEFITIKRTMGVITNANLSVCLSDRFMEAVKADAAWDLLWGGKVFKTIKARYLWDLICESAWASGEPGIFFIERANQQSNTWYFEKLISTNPCVAGDTRILTDKGLLTIKELYKNNTDAQIILDGRLSDSSSAKPEKIIFSGIKKVYKLKTKEGYEIKVTGDHQIRTERGWVEARKLQSSDKLFILNRKGGFGSEGDIYLGQLLGRFVGDGHFNKYDGRATLSFFGAEKKELAPLFSYSASKMLEAVGANSTVLSASAIKGRDEVRLRSLILSKLFIASGLTQENKLRVPEQVWRGTEEMQKGFLQALFTADGNVSGVVEKGISVRLTSISNQLLKEVQLLLINFGIVSKIYENRRNASIRMLPNGAGGYSPYFCEAQHELAVAKNMLKIFAKEIGFLTSEKKDKLNNLLNQYKQGAYNERFMARFASLELLGEEEVYDITETTTHSFVGNGLVVHNCGEQPLGAWGVCNLGAINLSAFVKEGEFYFKELAKTVRQAAHFLDNVIDKTDYAYKENEETQKNVRRIGLGTMGLADALIKLKIRYGSDAAIEFCEKIYSLIRDEAYRESIELAKKKGAFPQFDKEKYLEGYFIQTLPADIKEEIKNFGIRNAVLHTQAPTGSTGLLAGASSGIEPVYDFVVIRKDRLGEHEINHPLYEEYRQNHPDEPLPDHFVTAKELTPEEHVKMQATIQKYVDASISKTVNAPSHHTVEDVKTLYLKAYNLGCKGLAYFRDGSRDLAVLYSKEVKQTDEPEKTAILPEERPPQIKITPKPRPEVVSGSTYKIKTGYGTLFVTVNNDEEGKAFEVFATIGKTGGFFAAKSEAICRLISLALRSGIDVEEIIEQLRGIRGPMPSWSRYGQVLSIPDAISHILREHISSAQQKLNLQFKDKKEDEILDEGKIKELPAAKMDESVAKELHLFNEFVKTPANLANRGMAPECPECHAVLELSEGCMLCRSCGYSKCG